MPNSRTKEELLNIIEQRKKTRPQFGALIHLIDRCSPRELEILINELENLPHNTIKPS